MGGSKILVIFLFILTIALGGVAIWIGWRLSQEEEVTPEESEAYPFNEGAIGDIINVCGGVPFQIPADIWNNRPSQCRGCHSRGCDVRGMSGCYIQICRCRYGEQYSNGYECRRNCSCCQETATYRLDFNDECAMIQIDAVCSGSAVDFVVWRGRYFDRPELCGQTTTTTTPPTTTTTTTTTTAPPTGGGMTCDSLVASRDLNSITEDDLRTQGVTVSLTTTATLNNVTVGSRGYDYGTDVPGATFSTDPGSSTTQFTIPQGTENGTYNVWVLVTGSGENETYESGCLSATNCVGEGESCLLTFSVGGGTCDCESVNRSPSASQLPAGSNASFTMTAEDQNGVPCEVAAIDVHWSTTGSPALVQQERIPTSGEAVQHHIIYEIPEGASSGTEYCVSAEVDANGVNGPCENCFTIAEVPEEPAFTAVKTRTIECINNNTAARITYNIHVRNISNVQGVIEYVQDTYDSRFQSSWVSGITPTPDSHSNRVIRWDNNDNGYTLEPDNGVEGGSDELDFSYIVTVPASAFGTSQGGVFVPYRYVNNAVVQPEGQDEINLSTVVEIICSGLPLTGVMDDAIKFIIVAYLLVMLGLMGMRVYGVKELEALLGGMAHKTRIRRREKFERKVVRGS